MSEELRIELIQYETVRSVGPVDAEHIERWPPKAKNPSLDIGLKSKIAVEAKSHGASTESSRKANHTTGSEVNYGGMSSVMDTYEILSVAWPLVEGVAAVGGCTAFVKAGFDKLREWREGREGRSVNIHYKGKTIAIRDGQSVEEVVAQIDGLVRR